MLPTFLKEAATHVIGVRGKKWIKYSALRLRTTLGKKPFTSDHGLDRAVLKYLPRSGFFIEAGANDGFSNSNTYYLERYLGWRGLLVEPVPHLAAFSRRTRKAPVIEAALGSPELSGSTVTLGFADAMSRIGGAPIHLKWAGILGQNPKTVKTTVRTLSEIITEAGNPTINFLSLDVEGYEMEVLKGLDLSVHTPHLILIETAVPDAVQGILGSGYKVVEEIAPGDYLFQHEAPLAR